MKKPFEILIFCAIGLILLANNCFGQWQANVMLTNSPESSATSMNNARSIAASDYALHVVFTDGRDGDAGIYYKRSADQGENWEIESRLSDFGNASSSPSIAVSGSVVHVVWNDERDGFREIYYKRSVDDGLTWSADTRLTYDPDVSTQPSLSASGSSVNVVWVDDRTGNSKIFYKHSSDGGITWGADQQLESNEDYSQPASVASSGTNVHVVWYSMAKSDNRFNLFYTHSTDDGSSWSTPVPLTNDITCVYPSIAVSGSTVHLVWYDGRHGGAATEIYYKQSIDGGNSWSPDTRMTNNTGYSSYPFVTASGHDVHLTWQDNPDAKFNIYYRQSLDDGLTWESEIKLSNAASAFYASMAVSASAINVIWTDRTNGNDDIYLKRNIAVDPVAVQKYAKSESKLTVYPNPFLNEITADINDNKPCEIILFDIFSRKIFQRKFTNTVTLETSQIAKGIYICEVRNASGVFLKSKLVKN